jgi:RNA polymerase sigma factor (sigma-70 family)
MAMGTENAEKQIVTKQPALSAPTPAQLKAVHIAAVRQSGKVRRYRDIDAEDIEQEAWLSMLSAAKPFDPAKSKFSTYAGTMVSRRAVDLHRTRARRPAVELGDYDAAEIEPLDSSAPELAEWVQAVRLGTDRRDKKNMFGRTFTRGQELAVALIALRCRISSRAVVSLINSRDDLKEALDMSHAPSWRFIAGAVATYRKKIVVQTVQTSPKPEKPPIVEVAR